jgi:hypothetical protein
MKMSSRTIRCFQLRGWRILVVTGPRLLALLRLVTLARFFVSVGFAAVRCAVFLRDLAGVFR